MFNRKVTYTVFWDNSNGTDWDETFDNALAALACYKRLKGHPYRELVMTDGDGDHLILNSNGENNIDKLHIRYLFNLAGALDEI